jgi:hypothetical protein
MCLDNSDKLWGWGYNGTGLLGISNAGTITYSYVPLALNLISFPEISPNDITGVTNMWCTSNTSNSDAGVNIIKTYDINGIINYYYAGPNDLGYSGMGAGQKIIWTKMFNPTIPPFDGTYEIINFYFGSGVNRNSNFVIAKKNNIWSLWATGYNSHGELGIGNTTDKTNWTSVPFVSDKVKMISNICPSYKYAQTGGQTYILLTDGSLYFAGYSIYNFMPINNYSYVYFTKVTIPPYS